MKKLKEGVPFATVFVVIQMQVATEFSEDKARQGGSLGYILN